MEKQETQTRKFAAKLTKPYPPELMIGYTFLFGIMVSYAPQYLQITSPQFVAIANYIALFLFSAAVYLLAKMYKFNWRENIIPISLIYAVFTCPLMYIGSYDLDHNGDHSMALNFRIMSYLSLLIILTIVPVYVYSFFTFIRSNRIDIPAILKKIPAIVTSLTLITTLIIQITQIFSSIFHF